MCVCVCVCARVCVCTRAGSQVPARPALGWDEESTSDRGWTETDSAPAAGASGSEESLTLPGEWKGGPTGKPSIKGA